MKKRYPIIIGIILLAALVVASFFDLQISSALYFKNNVFSFVLAIIGEYLTFGGLAYFGGLLLKTSSKLLTKKAWQVLFTAGAVIYFVVSGFLFGHELSEVDALGGVNSIFTKIYIYAPLGIALVCPSFLLGLKMSKMLKNKKQFASIVALSFAILASLVVVMGVKELACRPRFTYVIEYHDEIFYRNWWQFFSQKELYMDLDNVDSNMFKSLPSGHACYSMCGLMVAASFPVLDLKFDKFNLPVFFSIVAFSLVVSFSRILCGMHYLSDVLFGMIIALFMYTVYCIFIKNYMYKLGEIQ